MIGAICTIVTEALDHLTLHEWDGQGELDIKVIPCGERNWRHKRQGRLFAADRLYVVRLYDQDGTIKAYHAGPIGPTA